MELHRSDSSALNLIKTPASGEFIVNDVLYKQSIIVTMDDVIEDWSARSVADLRLEDFNMLADFDAEILILGTGRKLVFPDSQLFSPLVQRRCGYEVMNSRSACITFNLLLGDARKVVAALLSQ